ncbi:hypothetical protein PTTG_25568 [Puccinia triticina 1-1 BBBD Race 1]|uniref:Uncharacterized protein n=1 Tax=Puccinia triticina (isolate 1-1 / race 1 (BBBD)) TaxID=630390 RepID=A0A180H3J0_PUCT1|nr:hypothetical protein PTTG_25568 [Puccinia triticina 1-1 BBBD Race 1]
MHNILILSLAVHWLPITQCMLEANFGIKGKNLASNTEIHSGSNSILAAHSSNLEESVNKYSQCGSSTTDFHTKEENDVLQFIETIPQLGPIPKGREQGGNLAVNEVKNHNSPKGRKTLIEILLQDLYSIKIDSPEINWNYDEYGQGSHLIEALEEVDKLLLVHIKYRLSVLTGGNIKLPSSRKDFPALEILVHGNILRNIYNPQDEVVVTHPIRKILPKFFKDVSKHFHNPIGKVNFQDIPTHCKDTRPIRINFNELQSTPVLEEIITHADNCQCPMSQATVKLVEKMLVLGEELDSIIEVGGHLRREFRTVYFKAINFMYKHELIAVENLQSLFDKNNLEYAASQMKSLHDWYHNPYGRNNEKFWYPTVTEGGYNRWYMSDYTNLFRVLQKEQKDYLSYYLLFKKFEEYLHLFPIYFETDRSHMNMGSFCASFLSIEPDNYYKERTTALETIQPDIQEALKIFKLSKKNLTKQGGLTIIILSQFFEFLQVYHPQFFSTVMDVDQDLIKDLKLLNFSKQLITEVDKFRTYISQNHHLFPDGDLAASTIKVKSHARTNLFELDQFSKHVDRMVDEHAKTVSAILQVETIDDYFFQHHMEETIESFRELRSYKKMWYELRLTRLENR